MKIENLANIINAKIQNEPAISEINGFCIDFEQVKFGQCCFVKSFHELKNAIKNKAYCVVYDFESEIIDQEIAFLKVSDLKLAIFRLIRFFGTKKNINFVFADTIKFEILKRIKMRFKVISENSLLHEVCKANENDFIFLKQSFFMDKISFSPIILQNDAKVEITNNSLFFCNLICEKSSFELTFPRFFAHDFGCVIKFLKNNNINFKLNDFSNFPYFQAIFVNLAFKPVSFGASSRAIICEKDENLFIKQAEFLLQFDLKSKILLPKNSKINLQNAIYFDNINEIYDIKDFRYILVLYDYEELYFILNDKKTQITLFD